MDNKSKTAPAKNTVKPTVNATAKATTANVDSSKTAKPATAKKPAAKPATAKATTAKKPAAKPAKKERKSRKGITRSFAAEVTASVNPVMASVNAFITNPETSEDALKMIRLELRKSVRATRSTINARKSTKA